MINKRRSFSRSLDWNLLKLFHEIAVAGSQSQAAENLNRKQPTVSTSLRRLEDLVRVRLCERGPRGIKLTRQGRVLAEMIEHIVEMVEDVPDAMVERSSGLSGNLHLLIVSNLVHSEIDRAMKGFHDVNPLVEIDIDVAPWSAVQETLLRRESDVGIAPATAFHPQLNYSGLFYEVHRPYCGRGHPLFERDQLSIEELSDCAFILTEADEPEDLRRYRVEHRLGIKVAGRSAHLEEAKRLAKLGVGVCILPQEVAAHDVENGTLRPVKTQVDPPHVAIYAITHCAAENNSISRRFIESFGTLLSVCEAQPKADSPSADDILV